MVAGMRPSMGCDPGPRESSDQLLDNRLLDSRMTSRMSRRPGPRWPASESFPASPANLRRYDLRPIAGEELPRLCAHLGALVEDPVAAGWLEDPVSRHARRVRRRHVAREARHGRQLFRQDVEDERVTDTFLDENAARGIARERLARPPTGKVERVGLV